jgi:hypothetical protein
MSKHEEFPELTPEAKECLAVAYKVPFPWHEGYKDDWTEQNRKGMAAFLRTAMTQALASAASQRDVPWWDLLEKIADNLHSPPPPPTLAEAREADLDTPEGRDAVRAFLATLREGGRP